MLSDSESDDERDVHQITINEHYAKAFEYRKEREELQKLKDQYGSDPDSEEEEETDSESAESEDSDGEELTPAMDAAILRTLARIKRKDPEIYTGGKDIFAEEQEKSSHAAKSLAQPASAVSKGKEKGKPLTIRAANLQNAMRSHSASPEPDEAQLTHVEEQKRLRQETIAAFHAHDDESDGEDDFLVPREKNMEELAREENEYREFLEKQVGDLHELVDIGGSADAPVVVKEEEEGERKKKKKKKRKAEDAAGPSKEAVDQEFLVNYILNRGWIDKSAKRLPTYKEVTSSKKGKAKSEDQPEGSDGDDDEEEIFDDIVDRFESSYNFRFEETDGNEIKTYPRTLPSTVRREDTTRKDARERRKQRKAEELAQRKEEVKRLKGLKMKEIRARLERAGVATGEVESLNELGIDLDAPWDPDAHDKQMAGLYALNGEDDGDNDGDDEKPTWNDDIDIGDIYVEPDLAAPEKKRKKKKKKKDEAADEDGVDVDIMDADVVPEYDAEEEWDGTEEMRKRKLKEWMDEIYALDFNDIVGGQTTRFHYTSVAPQNYSLTASEILEAKDAELNEYMGIKKYAPYRQENKSGWDSHRNERLKEFKGKISERLGHVPEEAPEKKKRKGKKERMREKGEANGEDDSAKKRKREEPEAEAPAEESGKKKRRRKKKDTEA
ncbi:Kri1-C domain-containing protein [Mycena indigotica]|uniref:Kri1-C domain-containing protein n=1 Tax=Mycena indigotica TaxID=2126181 RepID=A0A8H6RYL8_9AGAR|nr:Kri1-C domain-containing protein [Mycena indigotica]KAF7289267.1 Kri1-C domain-containing protein [Mycena indigotica]